MRKGPSEGTYLLLGLALIGFLAWFAFAYQRCQSSDCVLADVWAWQELLAGLIAIVAALIGGYFVLHSTRQQIELLSAQFAETIRPFIVARLSVAYGTLFVLEIENTGQSMATNLRLSLDRDFFQFGEKRNLRSFAAFNEPIPNFAPREKLTFDLSQGFNMKDEKRTPHSFTVRAEYEFESRRYSENFLIDTSHYMNSNARKLPEEHLEEIAKHLKQIASK